MVPNKQVWVVQMCHLEQTVGRSSGQSLQQKQSFDFVDSRCSQRPGFISRELKLPGLCAVSSLISLQIPSGQTNSISRSAPSIPKNTIAQSAGWGFNHNSRGSGACKMKTTPLPEKFPWKEQPGLCEELRKRPTDTVALRDLTQPRLHKRAL